MDIVIPATESSEISLSSNRCFCNGTNSSVLRVNSNGSFTYHYAVWPYVCLFCIMILVWSFVYLSTIFSQRHRPKFERRRMSSIFTSIGSRTVTAGGGRSATGNETSTLLTSFEV